MSFNLRGSFRDLGTKDAWSNRASLNAATIGRHAPDVVGLQECQRGNLAAYRRHLPQYEILKGPRYGNVPPHDFNAILYKPQSLRLAERGGFWLSETPEKHSRSWETRVARSANWALFHMAESDFPLLHLNTHLDHKSGLARREGSALIVKKVDDLLERFGDGVPAVLTGDFNCRPGTPTYRIFTGGGFTDTFLAAGNADGQTANTFHAFEGEAFRARHPERGPRRIDWSSSKIRPTASASCRTTSSTTTTNAPAAARAIITPSWRTSRSRTTRRSPARSQRARRAFIPATSRDHRLWRGCSGSSAWVGCLWGTEGEGRRTGWLPAWTSMRIWSPVGTIRWSSNPT